MTGRGAFFFAIADLLSSLAEQGKTAQRKHSHRRRLWHDGYVVDKPKEQVPSVRIGRRSGIDVELAEEDVVAAKGRIGYGGDQ